MSIPSILTDLILPLAQGAPAGAPAGGGAQPPPWAEILRGPMPLIMALLVIFWVFMARTKRREAKDRQDLLSNIKRGDRVETVGGILGKVVDAETSKVLLKVDESSNTKIWFSRKAIHRVLGEEKEAVK